MRYLLRSSALCLALIFGAGCYGQFALTKKIHAWNGSVSGNKFVQSLIFWGLVIIPVYEVSAFVDAVFFNLVEFWTGSNMLASSGQVKASAMADGSMVFRTDDHEYRIYPDGPDAARVFVDGQFAARAERTETGAVAISDGRNGQTIEVAASEVATLTARFGGR